MEPIEIARRFRGDKTSIHDAVTVASAQAIRQLLESLENETSLEKRYAVLNSEHFWDDYFDNNLLAHIMESSGPQNKRNRYDEHSAQYKAVKRYNARHGQQFVQQKLFTYPADLLLFASKSGHLASNTTRTPSTTNRGESLPAAAVAPQNIEGLSHYDDSDAMQSWILELRTSNQELATIHQSLPSAAWFRLLVISPGSFGDPLHLKLIPVQIEWAKNRYEALSYCWHGSWNGRTELLTPIQAWKERLDVFCNSQQIYIDEHLTHGLQHIRHGSQYRALWVDALCINQSDTEERKQQVSIMDRIYSEASRTLIWLGRSHGDETAHGLNLLCQLVNTWNENQQAHFSLFDPKTNETHIYRPAQEIDVRTLQQKFRDLNGVFGFDWFERRWVIQEVVLSQSAEILIGHFRISWQWIGLASALLRTNYTKQLDSLHHSYFRHRAMNAYLMYRMSPKCGLPLVELSLLQMLRLTSTFRNSENLDTIYALRGLASNLKHKDTLLQLGVDYNRSDTELRLLLANALMGEERLPLDFLTEAGLWGGNQTQMGSFLNRTPSWLPYLNARRSRCLLGPWELGGAFRASKGFEFIREPRDDPMRLCIGGTLTSTVLWRGEGLEFSHPSAAGYGIVLALLNSRALSRGLGASSQPDHDIEQNLELLARVLTAGRDLQDRREQNPKAYLGSLAAGLAWYRPGSGGRLPNLFIPEKLRENASTAPFAEIAEKVGSNRTLFVTMHGHLGMGPIEMQSGDQICILGGASMPFVLRKAVSDDGEPFHRLIGECYVDGIMDGEAVIAMNEQQFHRGPLIPKHLLENLYSFPSMTEEGRRKMDAFAIECLELSDGVTTKPAKAMIELR